MQRLILALLGGDNPLKNHLQNYFLLAPQLTAERQLLFTAILTTMLDIGQDSNFTSVEQRGGYQELNMCMLIDPEL